MADNVNITAGAGTAIAADDIGSVWYQRVKLGLGVDGTAVDAVAGAGAVGTGVQRVTLASDDPAVAKLTNNSFSANATFTPAATGHSAGDTNGATQEFLAIGTLGLRVQITSATLRIDGGNAEATAWRLYLYNVTPPSALADDAVFDVPAGDRASFLGYVDLGTALDLGSTQWVETNNINKQIKLQGAATSVFGYLVNISALTPAAVGHVVTLHAVGV